MHTYSHIYVYTHMGFRIIIFCSFIIQSFRSLLREFLSPRRGWGFSIRNSLGTDAAALCTSPLSSFFLHFPSSRGLFLIQQRTSPPSVESICYCGCAGFCWSEGGGPCKNHQFYRTHFQKSATAIQIFYFFFFNRYKKLKLYYFRRQNEFWKKPPVQSVGASNQWISNVLLV